MNSASIRKNTEVVSATRRRELWYRLASRGITGIPNRLEGSSSKVEPSNHSSPEKRG